MEPQKQFTIQFTPPPGAPPITGPINIVVPPAVLAAIAEHVAQEQLAQPAKTRPAAHTPAPLAQSAPVAVEGVMPPHFFLDPATQLFSRS